MTEDELTNIEWARQREALFAKEAAELELERKRVLTELNGRLWHTTHPDRFTSILTSHAILPEPSIPDGERSFTVEVKNTTLTFAPLAASAFRFRSVRPRYLP